MRGSFTEGSKAQMQFALNAAVVDAMEAAGVKKLSGSGDFHGGTNAKAIAAEELRVSMRTIRDTAKVIAEAKDRPEFDDKFRMPSSRSYDVLLTAGRAFHQEASDNVESFGGYELPESFLEDLQADIDALENADDTQDEGLGDQVGGTATLEAEVVKGHEGAQAAPGAGENQVHGRPRGDGGVGHRLAHRPRTPQQRRAPRPAPPEG